MKLRHGCVAALSAFLLLTSCTSVPFSNGKNADSGDASVLSRDLAALRAKQIAHVSYILWFGVDGENTDYQGRAVLNIELREKFRELSKEVLIDFEAGKIDSFRLNDSGVQNQDIPYDGHFIRLRTKDLLPGLNRLEIAFSKDYAAPGSNGLVRWKDPADGQVYLSSLLGRYDARRVFPCFDQPDLKGSYEVTVDAPLPWKVVSATMERETTKIGNRMTWAFPPSPVFSTHLFSLHTGPFESWKDDTGGTPLRLFVRRSQAKALDHGAWLKETATGLQALTDRLSMRYPFSKYDQILLPPMDASPRIAHAGAATVAFSQDLARPASTTLEKTHRSRLILEELSRMWLGGWVTGRWWNSQWTHDSLATLTASAALRDSAGTVPATQEFLIQVRRPAWLHDGGETARAVDVPILNTNVAQTHFNAMTYSKSAAVMNQLVKKIGEDEFQEGIHRYLLRYSLRTTTPTDLFLTLSEASGDRLQDWQKAWLHTAGISTVEADWECKPNERGKNLLARLTLKQTGPGSENPAQAHHLRLALHGKQPETLDATYTGPATDVSVKSGTPCPSAIVVNADGADYARVKLDPVTLAFFKSGPAKIADPIQRLILWQSLEQMMLDGSLSPVAYLEFIHSKMNEEKDATNRKALLDTVPSVLPKLSQDLQEAWRKRFKLANSG